MTDDRNKMILSSLPKKFPDFFMRVFESEAIAKDVSKRFIIPRLQLTMPQIMSLEKPCLTCSLTDRECPDHKEDIVMCCGDYKPFDSWAGSATNRMLENFRDPRFGIPYNFGFTS